MIRSKISSLIAMTGLVLYTALPMQSFAASGAIWTTNADCGDNTQNENQYEVGDNVYIHGENFAAGNYNWQIQTPGASGDILATGSESVDAGGSFCFLAYTVKDGDSGPYQVKFDNKNDNFQVKSQATDAGGGGDETASLTVIKHVVGGDKVASDFRLYVSKILNENDSVILEDFQGSESGTTFELPSGIKYHVAEDELAGYEQSLSGDCHGDIAPGDNLTCTVTNTFTGDESGPMGTIDINKYICDESTVFTDDMTPDADGNATIPETCEKATTAFPIGAVYEAGNATGNPPYPDFSEFALLGNTNSSGELSVDVPSGGRHFLTEGDSEGNFTGDMGNLIAFACEDDSGTHTNNFEAVYVETDATEYCNIYNFSGGSGGSAEGTMLHFIKVICPSYSDITGNGAADKFDATNGEFTNFSNYSSSDPHFADAYAYIPVNPNEIPEGCSPAAGWSFKLATNENQTDNVQLVGPTDESGMYSINSSDLNSELADAVASGDQLWVSEVGQDSVASFAALRCYKDATNGDNLEFVQLDPENMPSDVYCIAYNVIAPKSGNVVITKYVCPVDIDFDTSADSAARPDNSGAATVPSGCSLANGFHFGYIHEPNSDTIAAPYPGLDDNTSFVPIAGQTGDDGTGKLVLTNLPTGGRLDLAELNSDNNRVSDDDVIGFMCNEDTGIQDNNYEVVFNAQDKTSYCNVYNVSGAVGGEETSFIHLIKVICPDDTFMDSLPTIDSDNPVGTSEIPGNCDRASGWNFNLSTDSEQTAPTTFGETDTNGEFVVAVNSLSTNFQDTLNSGGPLWVSESVQDEIATLATLRCNTDGIGTDNLDSIQFLDTNNVPSDVYCIAYNIAAENTDTDTGGGGGGGGSSSPRRISGTVYNDLNGNGDMDNDESGLAGWTVYLDDNDNNVWDADELARTTDSDGDYLFTGLSNGDYTVREVLPGSWTQTEPGSGNDFEYHISITSGDRNHPDNDFGNITGTVSGITTGNQTPGEVLGESIDLGGSGESLPVTGLAGSSLILLMILTIAGVLFPKPAMRKIS